MRGDAAPVLLSPRNARYDANASCAGDDAPVLPTTT